MGIGIMDALKITTEQIRDWVDKTKADKNTVDSMSETLEILSSAVKTYNVEFYNLEDDEEVLLYAQENITDCNDPVLSGAITTPIKLGVDDPTKYDFIGWNPSCENIQEDTKCYAMFRYNGYIEDDWTTIADNIKNGTATTLYPIGAHKEISITLSDGIKRTIDVEIIAYNHDDLADGSGKATLTFFCKNLPDLMYKMYKNHINSNGWSESDIRAFVNGELYEAFPEELRNIIKPVIKISDGGLNNKTLVETVDYCWLLSYDEAWYEMNRTDNIAGQGQRYTETFGEDCTRIKYTPNGRDAGRWWLRTTSYGDSVFMLRTQTSGGVEASGLWNKYYVAFGFCV